MIDDPAVSAVLSQAARELERLADAVADLLGHVGTAREAFTVLSADAARREGFSGSLDQYDAAVASSVGFDRVDAARRRISAVVRDPWDDVPLPAGS